MYWKDPLNILLLCLTESETDGVIEQFHEGACGGNYAWKATAYKILRASFYWLKLFSHVGEKVRSCIPCQIFAGKQRLVTLPLVTISVEAPFLQRGLDFIGEIIPSSSNQHRWILTTTGYFKKWVESILVKNATDTVVIKFIEENIFLDLVVLDKQLQIILKLSVVLR